MEVCEKENRRSSGMVVRGQNKDEKTLLLQLNMTQTQNTVREGTGLYPKNVVKTLERNPIMLPSEKVQQAMPVKRNVQLYCMLNEKCLSTLFNHIQSYCGSM